MSIFVSDMLEMCKSNSPVEYYTCAYVCACVETSQVAQFPRTIRCVLQDGYS